MEWTEQRRKILRVLSVRGHATAATIAMNLGLKPEAISNDLRLLSCHNYIRPSARSAGRRVWALDVLGLKHDREETTVAT